MAIWQFQFLLCPAEWAHKNKNGLRQFLSEDGWDLSSSWKASACRSSPEKIIDQYLPRTTSWSDDLILWAQTASDSDIHLFHDAGKTVELEIRIDARKEYSLMLEHAVSIANNLSCVFFLKETETIITPSVQTLELEILDSRAMRFVIDPVGTLSK